MVYGVQRSECMVVQRQSERSGWQRALRQGTGGFVLAGLWGVFPVHDPLHAQPGGNRTVSRIELEQRSSSLRQKHLIVTGTLQGSGNVLLFAKEAPTLYQFDRQLTLLRVWRMKGYVDEPVALLSSGESEVLILDAATGFILRFALTTSSETAAVDTIVTNRGASGMCRLGHELFVYAYDEEFLITVVDLEKREATRRFGGAFGKGSDIVKFVGSHGGIGCLPDRGILLVSSDLLGEVRGYRTDGTLLWARRLPAFRRVLFELLPDESYRSTRPAGGFESTVGIFGDIASAFVQIGLVTGPRTDHQSYSSYRVTVLDAESGRIQGEFSVPQRVVAVREGHIYMAGGQPVPFLSKYRSRETTMSP